MDKMISISEAGRLLGVTPRTLKRWDTEGKLKVYRTLGNHRRYKLSDIEPNEEMVQDLVSIVTCFSAKIYGARGGKKMKKTLVELEKERQEEQSENNYESNANKCNQ